jgi:hypothetical protein
MSVAGACRTIAFDDLLDRLSLHPRKFATGADLQIPRMIAPRQPMLCQAVPAPRNKWSPSTPRSHARRSGTPRPPVRVDGSDGSATSPGQASA